MSGSSFWKDRFWGIFDNLAAAAILTVVLIPFLVPMVLFVIHWLTNVPYEIVLKYVLLLLSALALLLAILGVCESGSSEEMSCKHYGIQVLSPQDRDHVGPSFTVRGTYKRRPPDGSIRLFKIDISDQYWPVDTKISYDDAQKGWEGQVLLPDASGTRVDLRIAIVGEAGNVLCEYFERVGESGHKYGIRTLTPDVQECGRAVVVV